MLAATAAITGCQTPTPAQIAEKQRRTAEIERLAKKAEPAIRQSIAHAILTNRKYGSETFLLHIKQTYEDSKIAGPLVSISVFGGEQIIYCVQSYISGSVVKRSEISFWFEVALRGNSIHVTGKQSEGLSSCKGPFVPFPELNNSAVTGRAT